MNSQYKTVTIGESQLKKQRGVVLFIALIALVVMSLAAVALIRSVDTSTIIAGNLASKQSATISADSGVETAIAWLSSAAITANPSILNSDNAANAALGYYATQLKDPTTFAWNASDSSPAKDATGLINANGTDASGNTIRYVIQRMCRVVGAPLATTCLFGAPVVGSNSQAVRPAPSAGAATSTDQSPMYRVTARVTGAKNTVSYIQAFVY